MAWGFESPSGHQSFEYELPNFLLEIIVKKSDLPWMLPLLTAWSQGKTLQIMSSDIGQWEDWKHPSAPMGNSPGGAADYRIKPALKTPLQVYGETAYPDYKGKWSEAGRQGIVNGLSAVIRAYIAGELILPEELK